MVKCPVCGKKFKNHIDFYRHWEEKEAENETEKMSPGLKTLILPRNEKNLNTVLRDWDKTMLEKYGMFVDAQIHEDKIVVRYDPSIKQKKWAISVWDCRGEVICPHSHRKEEYRQIGYFDVPPCIVGNDEEIERFLWEILDDHGGAINMSGLYYFDDDHMKKLSMFLDKKYR